MALVKVIEVLAQSDTGWEDAAKVALHEAQKTVRNVKSIYCRNFQAIVEDGKIVEYRLDAKISFLLDR